ncbi:MAG: hypothetical protein ABIO16_01535 [Nocardioides sp.]
MRLRQAATVALLMGAVAVVGPPAEATPCPGTSGVTVVVELNGLGGGSSQSCVADGGGHTADRLLRDAGHSVDYVQRFPGFVCRIDGAPADDPCVNTPPADAYWGLWWSDGTTGRWTYSSLGAASLAVPAGGYVAMVWDGSTGTVRPAATPAAHPTSAPTPTATPTATPTKGGTPTGAPTRPPRPEPTTSPTSVAPTTTSATPTNAPTKKPTPKPTKSEAPTPSASSAPSPSASPTLPPAADDDSGDSDSGGLPGWVPPVLVVALLAVAGAVAVVRRRRP